MHAWLVNMCGVTPVGPGRAQWAASPVSKQTISSCLGNTKDKVWVVEQTLNRTASSPEEQTALLEHGLAVSAAQAQGAEHAS